MKTKLREQSAFVGAGLDHFMLRDMKRALEPQDLIFAAVHSSWWVIAGSFLVA
jgi:hypothetical protein